MNIFYLDRDIQKCAEYHCDKHVVKMILEYAQLLSTASHVSGLPQGYAPTHQNHPCGIWVRKSEHNFLYLADLALAVNNEYKRRYSHSYNHKSADVIMSLELPNLPSAEWTEPPKCMPEQYKTNCVVESYRNYYNGDKARFAVWKNTNTPEWFNA